MSAPALEEDGGVAPELVHRIPAGWWERAFACTCGEPDCREWTLLMILAYDIRNPRRLRRVAKCCEDYGARVQHSVFEVRLNADRFDLFWEDVQKLMDPTEDRLVAYRVCNECSRKVRTAGTMKTTEERPIAHIF